MTYFNPETKEILNTERVTGKPSGFGVHNYRAGAVADILKKCHRLQPVWEGSKKK